MARTTVRAVTADGAGPAARRGNSVPVDAVALRPKARAASGETTSRTPRVDLAGPSPTPVPRGVRVPRVVVGVGPKAVSSPVARRVVSVAVVPRMGNARAAAPRMVAHAAAPRARVTADAADPGPVPVTPATASMALVPRAAVPPVEVGGAPAGAVGVVVPVRRNPTIVRGSSGSWPRHGSRRWPFAV